MNWSLWETYLSYVQITSVIIVNSTCTYKCSTVSLLEELTLASSEANNFLTAE